MKRIVLGVATLVALTAGGLRAQEEVLARERARSVLRPDVFEAVSALAVEMEAAGVPPEPLYAKALEGAAKRVPPERIVPAVRDYAGRLGEARRALGPGAGVPLLVAGADALQRGLPRDVLGSVAAERPRSPVALLMLAELHESGVPTDRALAMVRDAMREAREDRMLDLSARVRRLIRQGVPPADAVERVRRTLERERGRVGPPVAPGSEPLQRDRPRRVRGG